MSSAPDRLAGGLSAVDVRIWQDRLADSAADWVAEEVPVALVYNGEPHAVMMATPEALEDFARGFTLTEEIVGQPEEIGTINVRPLRERSGYQIDLGIPPARAVSLARRQRHLEGRSGCGLCGAQTIETAIRVPRRVTAGTSISIAAIRRALADLRRQQPLNAATGATHAAAWATADGLIVAVREDVGRHNALDKLIGHILSSHIDPHNGFLVLTSRASYEMVLKAAVVGVAVVVAISAPTAFAVRIAEEARVTLIAFAREDRQVIYTYPGRLLQHDSHHGTMA